MDLASGLRKVALMAAVCCLASLCAGQSASVGGGAHADERELSRKAFVKHRIRSIVQATLREGEFTTPEGIGAVTRVPPSAGRIEEVKNLGEGAIPILSDYVASKSPREQELAMRFLVAFGGEQIVEALGRFAKHSAFAMNRAQALQFLTQGPPSKILPIVEDVSRTDPDPYVRKTALEVLAKLLQ